MTIRETQFDGVLVRYDGKDAEIGYTTVPQKMRAQTILAMKTEKSRAPFTVEEHPVFDLCGPMLDVSRGGVMTVEAVCRYLDKTAALGMNMLMLYTEDTYEVKEYPTFGYLRGRYTIEELRAIDDHAAALGIEVIPCIQTLGHLLKFTRWGKVPTDVPGVLLPGDEAVYRFIDAELRAIRAAFRSRRIHLAKNIRPLLCSHIHENVSHKPQIVRHRIKDAGRLLRLHVGICLCVIFNLTIVGNLFNHLFV